MSKIPTAEEFFSSKNVTRYMRDNKISSIQETIVILGKELAKLYVEAALKKACEKVELDYFNGSCRECGSDKINESSILKAYPLENIK